MISPVPKQLRGLRGPILTIDGSLTQTGWALTAETGLLLQSGVLRSKAGEGWPADHRIYAIGQQLIYLIARLVRKPKHFGVEHQFFRPAGKPVPGKKMFQLDPETVAALARLEGVLIFVAKNSDGGLIDVLSMRAMEWRAVLGITGKDTKARGIDDVRRRLLLSGFPSYKVLEMLEDELEAVGLGMAVHHELSHGYPLHHRRLQIRVEKKTKRERAKRPKKPCGICERPMLRPGLMLDLLTGPVEVHIGCRKKKRKKRQPAGESPKMDLPF